MHIRPPLAWLIAGAAVALTSCTYPSAPMPIAAQGQACPPWVDYPADKHSNRDSPYLGCWTDVNLRNMVQSPGDLEHGRELGPANGEREAAAVMNYEQGKLKAFKDANAPVPIVVQPAVGGGGQ